MSNISTQQGTLHRGEVIEELYRAGLELKRCQLKRAHPSASPQEIEERLKAWLLRVPDDLKDLGKLTLFNTPHGLSTYKDTDE